MFKKKLLQAAISWDQIRKETGRESQESKKAKIRFLALAAFCRKKYGLPQD